MYSLLCKIGSECWLITNLLDKYVSQTFYKDRKVKYELKYYQIKLILWEYTILLFNP